MSRMPLHDSHLTHPESQIRVGMQHFAATDAERDGAKANLKGKAALRTKIYDLIVAAGSEGKTNAEIRDETNTDPNVISGRLTELETKFNLIMKSGERRKSGSAHVAQNVWVKVPIEGTLL